MDGASRKADLLARMETAHQELDQAFDGLSEGEMSRPELAGGWSVKDILSHLTFWEQRVIAYMRRWSAGEEQPDDLLPGEDNDARVNRLNEDNFQRNRLRPLDEVLAEYGGSYRQMHEMIAGLSEEDAAPGGRIEREIGCDLNECFAGDTYEHYEEHMQAILHWRAGREGATG